MRLYQKVSDFIDPRLRVPEIDPFLKEYQIASREHAVYLYV